jgi:hypothetical protein
MLTTSEKPSMRFNTSLVLALALFGCSEYAINSGSKVTDDGLVDGDPDIEVDPLKINFGDLFVGDGETDSRTVTISNVSDEETGGVLSIDDVYLADTTMPYEISGLGAIILPPGAQTTFVVTFAPLTAEDYSTKILIDSNDPDEATTEVKILGQGVAPRIELSPTTYDFGTIYIGCETPQPVTVSNVGNADLLVSSFDYITASNDLTVDTNEGVNGALPWTVPPGESREVFVDYAPLDDYPDEGTVVVTSNDPVQPEARALQTAGGELYGENLDLFEQALKSATDILFIIDNSCSMAEEQSNLSTNFTAFAEELEVLDVDFQLAVITTDNPVFRGDILNNDTRDLVGEFVPQAVAGTSGSGNEMPWEMAYQSSQRGGDAGPGGDFLRDDAVLAYIFVSDEPDGSPDSWANYLAYAQSLKSDSDLFIAHAISGDWPSGCGSASATNNVYEATVATGGLYLSVCATDWASHLKALVDSSTLDLSSFELSDFPVPSSIEVTVDGSVQTSGWSYDAADNSVNFDDDHIPAGGSTIEVYYALYGNCAE